MAVSADNTRAATSQRYGPHLAAVALLGRDAEIGQVRGLLRNAHHCGGALTLSGEPGIGKTTLLRTAAAEAERAGLLVLETLGVPVEQHFDFAGLHRLVRPILPGAARLAPGHRQALQRAFGLEAYPAPSPTTFLVGLAALELVAEASARQAVLMVVDDLQWLDEASVEVIRFLGRRLASERAVLLMATRTAPTDARSDPVPVVAIAPLSPSVARAVVHRQFPRLASEAMDRVLSIAAGNPLALLELPRVVAALPAHSTSDEVPLTDRLENVFGAAALRLPPPTTALLLALAVQDGGTLADAWGVATTLHGAAIPADAAEPAVVAGLLTTPPTRFRHPLVRSAVQRLTDAARVSAAHQAWASTLSDTDPDRASWHRAAAADGPDATIADALERAADRAWRRGALPTAQRWLQRAAELSSGYPARQQRLLRAGEAAYHLGRYDDVQAILAELRSMPLQLEESLQLAWLEGVFDDGVAGDVDGVATLVSGAVNARNASHGDLALVLLMAAARRCWWSDLPGEEVVAVAHSLGVASDDPRLMVIDASAATLATAPDVLAALQRWTLAPPAEPDQCALLATAAFNLADFDRALRFADRATDVLRSQGRLSALAQMQVTRTWAALFLGRWPAAYTAADEAYRIAIETHQPVWAAHARLGQADLEGRLGNSERALALIADAERLAVSTGRPTVLSGVEFTRGIIELGRQRPAVAFEHLRRTLDPADRAYHRVERLWLIDYVTEAAVASGHGASVQPLVAEAVADVGSIASPGYSRALRLAAVHLADDDSVDGRVEEASDVPGPSSVWYQARLELAHGMSLRRRRRVAESRRPLTNAQLAFDDLGARAWAERARVEIAATGGAAPRAGSRAWLTLSPQELQIAQLAADGLSNREIGSRLYLSHRTVGSHLYRIFPKLGITSRAQLHLVLATEQADQPTSAP